MLVYEYYCGQGLSEGKRRLLEAYRRGKNEDSDDESVECCLRGSGAR